jgi:tetratricopeptide (TPR) repeat protein
VNADEHTPSWPFADAGICAALILAAVLVYIPATHFGFIGFDDPYYVTANMYVRGGLTLHGLYWALTSFQPDNWFPLTRLSHMLDYQLFGLNGPWHHAVNVAIHALASAMLYLFLRRATRARWTAAFVGAVFALHPLHVESVAWVSERKDVLCAFFWFATLWAWARYARQPSRASYLTALALFAAGLMSKPMIVTLPALLLVIDFWPLRREFSRRLLLEKVPFLALSLVTAWLTVLAQRAAGTIQSLQSISAAERLGNALVTVLVYLRDTFVPRALWTPYAWPSRAAWEIPLAGASLVVITALVWLWRRKRPFFLAGWLWFIITLVPVIGIVQAGQQSRADRYMYVPMTGILIAVAWGVAALAEFLRSRPARIGIFASAAILVCGVLAVRTWNQQQYWETSETLLRHAIEEDPDNYLAWDYLGQAISGSPGSLATEVEAYRTALRIRPQFVEARDSLGRALKRYGEPGDARAEFDAALRLAPGYTQARRDLGSLLLETDRTADAVAQFRTALQYHPDSSQARNDLAAALWRQGDSAGAIAELEKALALNPAYPLAHTNLGFALLKTPDRLADAEWHFEQALRMAPADVAAHLGLSVALSRSPFSESEGKAHLQAARQLEPDSSRLDLQRTVRTDDGTAL